MDPTENSPNDATDDANAPAPSSYRWNVPGSTVSVYIDFEVVDRLGFDIMRGFGAVPRRGAEVGGILLGTAEVSEQTVIRIEDYEPIPCEHMRGPSYILSHSDQQHLDEMIERWAPAPDKRICAVGYYRSNTRDVIHLAAEDIEILDSRFPAPTAICLMVKPYATRVSEAAIFVRQDGAFSTDPASQVFPFRRKELGGGKPLRRPRGGDPSLPEPDTALSSSAPGSEAQRLDESGSTANLAGAPGAQSPIPVPAPATRSRTGWVWFPLSFVFLLLGVFLGFQIALSYREKPAVTQPSNPYQLDLSVVQFGESVHLKWNTDSEAIHQGLRGQLHIQDGDNSKVVELQQEDLGRGGILYRNATQNVKFRLEIFVKDRNSVVESLELRLLEQPREAAPGGGPARQSSGRQTGRKSVPRA